MENKFLSLYVKPFKHYIKMEFHAQAGPLLSKINNPSDLKKIDLELLPQGCQELRQYIIDVVSVNGGHFGASLGVVELTVALHYVFDTPSDQLVWDVGHQAYGHKILTGRKDVFETNRKYQGISGFPKRSESDYDTFGVGHSSTSISAALGMAVASRLKGDFKKQHIAIIGDGAMTAGLAFEGLNNAGYVDSNILVILNDNNMSIDPNVGALNHYLTDVTTSSKYNRLRDDVWKALGKLGAKSGKKAQSLASKVEQSVKTLLTDAHANIFESLNLRYFGPADGHDVLRLVQLFKDLKKINGPKLLHIKTIKGKGYELAEKDQTKWHAPGLFDKVSGEIFKAENPLPKPPKYQDVFGHTMVELAKMDERILGITPAMPSGCSLNIMMKEMPERAFDVGIAEQHAVTFSAGLATQGMIPFCNIYSTFMQRAYDQVIHDVAMQHLHVVFCLDRGGLVGADGPTHHGAYDIAYMRCIPEVVVAAPMNEHELRNMMFSAAFKQKHTYSIRYPRGEGVLIDWKNPFKEITTGTGRVILEGEEIVILSFGHPGNFAVKAIELLKKEGINIGLYDMRFAKPLDTKLLIKAAEKYSNIITLEDGCIDGGFGSAVIEYYNDNHINIAVKRLGIPDHYIEHGEPNQLYKEIGIDAEGIVKSVKSLLKEIQVK